MDSRVTRGTVSVELALVAPVLVALLFGVVEMGWLVTNMLIVNAAARAGARVAAVGDATSQVTQRVLAVAESLDPQDITITQEYRQLLDGGTWTGWTVLTDTTQGTRAINGAPSGAELRVTVQYVHGLLMPSVFRGLADDPEAGTRTLSVAGVMRRE